MVDAGTTADDHGQFRGGAEVPVLYHVDGAGSSVTVKEDESGVRYLKVNGKADASTDRDMVTQLMLGHVPAMLHPDPKNALVVGLGSGVTSGALTAYPQMETVTTVEIHPEMATAAEYFREVTAMSSTARSWISSSMMRSHSCSPRPTTMTSLSASRRIRGCRESPVCFPPSFTSIASGA